MPSVPRLLGAFALVFALSAQNHGPEPLAPVDPAVWTQLVAWQKEYFNNQVRAGELKPFDALQTETASRERVEVQALSDQDLSWQKRVVQPSPEDIQRFIDSVRSLDQRFPQALATPSLTDAKHQVQERAAYYEQDRVYRDAHPKQAAAAQALQKQTAGIPAKGDPAALDKFFDNTTPGTSRVPPVVPPNATAAGAAPSAFPVKWRYVPASDATLSATDRSARRLNKTDVAEQQFIDRIFGTLSAPVEKEVVAHVAKSQAAVTKEYARRAKALDHDVALIKEDLARADISAADRKHLNEELTKRKALAAELRSFDPELIVTLDTLNEHNYGRTAIDEKPGPDGKMHMRLVLSRSLLFNEDPKGNGSDDLTRKLATHELTHVGDFFDLQLDKAPEPRFIEPRAFRNQSLSYKQEGMPQGRMIDIWAAPDYRWLTSDPVGWMDRQLYNYATTDSGGSMETLWKQASADDYADPAKAVDWRLQFVYRYATAGGGHTQPMGLDAATSALIPSIQADAKIPYSDKPAAFASQAKTLSFAKDWVAKLKRTPASEIAKARRNEDAFFESLKPLFQ